jgi:hypothetical protein
MSCNGCLLNEKERAQLWESKLKEAKQYAVKNNCFVVVYKNELGEAVFMEAQAARSLGITGQFVSPVQ